MKLPAELVNHKEWTLIGPMGPRLSDALKAFPLVGVDGGANFCEQMDLWVGDGDSNLSAIQATHAFSFPPKKDLSDLALAFSLFKDSTSVTLHCWGFLGGRKDHELLNFGEALRFLESKLQSQILFYDSESGAVSIKCLGPGTWQESHQGLFSLASLAPIQIKLTGHCEYQLPEETELLPLSSLGLSNSAEGNFTVSNSGPMMILFPETH